MELSKEQLQAIVDNFKAQREQAMAQVNYFTGAINGVQELMKVSEEKPEEVKIVEDEQNAS